MRTIIAFGTIIEVLTFALPVWLFSKLTMALKFKLIVVTIFAAQVQRVPPHHHTLHPLTIPGAYSPWVYSTSSPTNTTSTSGPSPKSPTVVPQANPLPRLLPNRLRTSMSQKQRRETLHRRRTLPKHRNSLQDRFLEPQEQLLWSRVSRTKTLDKQHE